MQKIAFTNVTISALTETGRAESSIEVPLQRSYTGRRPVIQSSLADTPGATLGIQGALDKPNAILRTSYTLDTPSLRSILEDCIAKNYDFGTAYGRLRGIWYTDDWSNIRDELRRCEEGDREMRRNALVGNRIVKPDLPPRRVWHVYSNRMVQWWTPSVVNGTRRIEECRLHCSRTWSSKLLSDGRPSDRTTIEVSTDNQDFPCCTSTMHSACMWVDIRTKRI